MNDWRAQISSLCCGNACEHPATANDACLAHRILTMPAPDRITLARAMVADMPGVMCGRVPEPIDYIDADECEEQYQFGHNDCRTAMLANGEADNG